MVASVAPEPWTFLDQQPGPDMTAPLYPGTFNYYRLLLTDDQGLVASGKTIQNRINLRA